MANSIVSAAVRGLGQMSCQKYKILVADSIVRRQQLVAWILFLIFLIVIPWPLQGVAPALLSRLCLVGIYAMVLIGLDLLVGYAGQVNLGAQGFFAIGAYTTAILTTYRLRMLPQWMGEPTVAMAMGIILSLLIGLMLAYPVLRTAHFYQAMVTLGFGMIVFSMVVGWREVLGGSDGISGVPPFSIGSLELNSDLEIYYLIWGLLLAILVFSLRLVRSSWGLACQALRSDEVAASVMGINTYQHKLKLFLITAVFASVAGSLYAHFLGIVAPESFSVVLIMMLFLGLFFGSVHTIWGALIGAALLQVIPELMGRLSREWPVFASLREFVAGIIFLIIIFYMPKGLLNTVSDLFHRWKQKTAA